MNQKKRAIYDDELLNNSEGVYYIYIGKFRINIILFTLFAILFFISKFVYTYYHNYFKVKFICPLGQDKFEIDELKYSENNMRLLNFIEKTKEELLKEGLMNSKKIAEDDEYEYYVEEESKN